MSTNYTNLNAGLAKVRPFSVWPGTPVQFYGEAIGQEANQPEWQGGEMMLYTVTNRMYIQVNTSGVTAAWKGLDATFATTTTTSTTTSTSSSTSTSTTTSSTTTSA